MALSGRQPTGPPSSDFRFFFVYNANAPLSLVGSVIEATSTRDEQLSATVLVTCAAGSDCPTDFPEQTISHMQGSSWAGEYTISGTATSWGCNLGHGTGDILSDQGGWCSAATAAPGETMPTGKQVKSSAVNVCFVETRSKLMFVTAGNDKWSIVEPTKPTLPPARLLEQRLGVLESLHCPVAASSSSLASSMGLISQSIAGAGTAGPTKSTGTITKPPVTGAGITSAATSALFHAPTSSATTTSSAPAGGGGHAGRGRGLACLLAGASALVTLLSG